MVDEALRFLRAGIQHRVERRVNQLLLESPVGKRLAGDLRNPNDDGVGRARRRKHPAEQLGNHARQDFDRRRYLGRGLEARRRIDGHIEVKSDPYLVIHSYDEISRIGYRISQDSTVQIKLLPPGETDINSPQAIQLLAPEVQQAVDGNSNPIDHTVEWVGYLPGDTNAVMAGAEGTYTFVIEATGVQSNLTSIYRGALQLFQ